jgi:electron transfer flavoprotein beta subunit
MTPPGDIPGDPPTDARSPALGPLVVACLRIADLRPVIDPLDGRVTRDRWGVGLSPADAAALEYTLRIASAWNGRVLAVCVGPESVEPALREVAALGVPVIRLPGIEERDVAGYVAELADDERALAGTLLAAVRPFGTPDLVLCGDRSVDRGTGALPAYLAHELGAAQALGLVALEPDGTGKLLAERRLDGGWRERIRLTLPAVCSVEGAGVHLRRASLAGALAVGGVLAPEAEVATPTASHGSSGALRFGPTRTYFPRVRVLPAPQSDDPRLRLLALTGALVAHDPPTVVHPVDAAEAADVLMAFLARHGYLDANLETDDVPDPGDGRPTS